MNNEERTVIEIRQLVREYQIGKQTIRALDNLDLEIATGELVAFTGPSGAGKSTLMHLIGGLDTPTSGEIVVNGQRLSELKDGALARYRNQQVGFVFQSFNLLPTMTALENVALPLVLAGVTRRERKELAKTALTQVGLSERLQHRPTELSGGEQQRVAIARAIVNQPQLLLADEPTGNLDSRTGQAIMELLSELQERSGMTVVIVTHNEGIATWVPRRVRLLDGQILQSQGF
jgi:putative ABC transport system ATP-binding protein